MRRKSLKEWEAYLREATVLTPEEYRELASDDRKGARALLERWEKRQEKRKLERAQYERMTVIEREWREKGYRLIAGIDEAGRGPLAGPVVSACVILPEDEPIYGINDSKQLSRAQRRHLSAVIRKHALAVSVGIATAAEIDALNIYRATKLAMKRAVLNLNVRPDFLLVDAMTVDVDLPQQSLVKGDARSLSIAAASIIAKETRDQLMEELDRRYPGYEFGRHMGYATETHLEALRRLGPCPEHRMSFAPIRTG